jgi:hypothetical protein
VEQQSQTLVLTVLITANGAASSWGLVMCYEFLHLQDVGVQVKTVQPAQFPSVLDPSKEREHL